VEEHAVRRYCQIVAVVAVSLFGVTASGAEPSPLARGRALFEKKCDPCHSLERSLNVREDRAGWESVIRRMIVKGAKLDRAQVEPILGYLAALSAFETRCSSCHDLERPLAAVKNPEQWQATVQRMAARKPGLLTDADAEAIVQYLLLVTPLEQGAPASGQR
jgi:cytochrome c2